MADEILIEVEGLCRDYSALRAVDGMSFRVHRGEVLGFLGPNGAGKSTTMQIVAGILAPTAGTIKVAGADIIEQPLTAKRQLGYLPENPPLYREFTVDEYLKFCARLHAVPHYQLKARMEETKRRCGLSLVGQRLIGNLSKGYQQRVGIAQAILHAPAVVILDEPTVGLDPIQIREIRALIRELKEDHSVILSTHILPEVQSVCDRVIIIAQGRLVMDTSMTALKQQLTVSSLRIHLKNPPALSALQEIAGVISAEALEQGVFRIHCAPTSNPTQALVQHSVNQHWDLQALIPEQRTLEEIFVQTVHSDRNVDAVLERQVAA